MFLKDGVFICLFVMPLPRAKALSDDVRLTSVCLYVAYIGLKSRTERPRKTKIGTEVAHVPRDSDYFEGQMVKGQLEPTCRNRCHLANKCEDIFNLQGRRHIVSPRAQLVFHSSCVGKSCLSETRNNKQH